MDEWAGGSILPGEYSTWSTARNTDRRWMSGNVVVEYLVSTVPGVQTGTKTEDE